MADMCVFTSISLEDDDIQPNTWVILGLTADKAKHLLDNRPDLDIHEAEYLQQLGYIVTKVDTVFSNGQDDLQVLR